jgi:hypothetical protein
MNPFKVSSFPQARSPKRAFLLLAEIDFYVLAIRL